MEKQGYVTRRQVADNRKNVYVHLTAKGRGLKGKLEPLAEEVNAIAVRGVPAADVAAARRTLLVIIENFGTHCTAAGAQGGTARRVTVASPRGSHARDALSWSDDMMLPDERALSPWLDAAVKATIKRCN